MTSFARPATANVDDCEVSAFRIPTDAPESDGTLKWEATTLVLVELHAGGRTGLGYTYADTAAATVIRETLAPLVTGSDVDAAARTWTRLVAAVRNLGRCGIAAMAVAAVDNALWDLRARLRDEPLCSYLGMVRDRVPVYGSGGFTSYSLARLREQLGGWAAAGIPRVKMKVGRDPAADDDRVAAARDAVGPHTELFVDANGAYTRKQALRFAETFAAQGVTWFEEPVDHLDRAGLAAVRERAPASVEISAGEYGYDLTDFAALVDGGCVDVLQADATRCLGITGLLAADGLCEARRVPLSTHCAPALHAHPATALKRLRHIEWFHDHARIERLLFDGVLEPQDGALVPDRSRPGNGLTFKRADAQRYAV